MVSHNTDCVAHVAVKAQHTVQYKSETKAFNSEGHAAASKKQAAPKQPPNKPRHHIRAMSGTPTKSMTQFMSKRNLQDCTRSCTAAAT